MSGSDTLPEGFTLRSKNKNCRITKDSSWCKARPYKLYIDGTADNIFGSLDVAKKHYPSIRWETIAEHDERINKLNQNAENGYPYRYGPLSTDTDG